MVPTFEILNVSRISAEPTIFSSILALNNPSIASRISSMAL